MRGVCEDIHIRLIVFELAFVAHTVQAYSIMPGRGAMGKSARRISRKIAEDRRVVVKVPVSRWLWWFGQPRAGRYFGPGNEVDCR